MTRIASKRRKFSSMVDPTYQFKALKINFEASFHELISKVLIKGDNSI